VTQLWTVGIAGLSLAVSGVTLYLTLLRKGTLAMTKPTALFFVRDGPGGPPKIAVTALLYSTSKRGQVVESMFLRLERDGQVQAFNEWIYWEGSKVQLGGVKVGDEGRTTFDHFLMSRGAGNYDLRPGRYQVSIHARLVGRTAPVQLFRTGFTVDDEHASAVGPQGPGLALLLDPETGGYRVQLGPPPSFRQRMAHGFQEGMRG
jgi:hypothetical protein